MCESGGWVGGGVCVVQSKRGTVRACVLSPTAGCLCCWLLAAAAAGRDAGLGGRRGTSRIGGLGVLRREWLAAATKLLFLSGLLLRLAFGRCSCGRVQQDEGRRTGVDGGADTCSGEELRPRQAPAERGCRQL